MLPAVGRVVVKGQDGQRHGHVDEQQTGQLVLFVSRCVVCWFSSRQKVHVNWPGLSQMNTAMSTGKGTFTVTRLHAADSCHEGRVNVTGQPCRRRQLEHVHRLLWAKTKKKNVKFSGLSVALFFCDSRLWWCYIIKYIISHHVWYFHIDSH